ncbi:MAG TPA: 16S rRNA (guanine(966)-N(2))-methyltransferase RsmD [Gammaproteobacteria bacterium]|jgi:16S rRNA (guanine966-N2)-methyltransferase|nr:16S rRNA (guanine(966)-N(2))-methyltransferase RsmD [Gammaproteobacteria bacterium]
MKPGTVRIIAGQWRSRRLKVPDIKDLRPTPDRVRETLFNWLSQMIAGARCLDLFAGSGVLGFEALSRGASKVVMVDESSEVVELLREQLQLFHAENGEVVRAKIPGQLKLAEEPFDIVFVDPPYQSGLLLPVCKYLEEQKFLADGAYIYLEAAETIKDNDLPLGWHIIKSSKAGQVAFHLVKRENK